MTLNIFNRNFSFEISKQRFYIYFSYEFPNKQRMHHGCLSLSLLADDSFRKFMVSAVWERPRGYVKNLQSNPHVIGSSWPTLKSFLAEDLNSIHMVMALLVCRRPKYGVRTVSTNISKKRQGRSLPQSNNLCSWGVMVDGVPEVERWRVPRKSEQGALGETAGSMRSQLTRELSRALRRPEPLGPGCPRPGWPHPPPVYSTCQTWHFKCLPGWIPVFFKHFVPYLFLLERTRNMCYILVPSFHLGNM